MRWMGQGWSMQTQPREARQARTQVGESTSSMVLLVAATTTAYVPTAPLQLGRVHPAREAEGGVPSD